MSKLPRARAGTAATSWRAEGRRKRGSRRAHTLPEAPGAYVSRSMRTSRSSRPRKHALAANRAAADAQFFGCQNLFDTRRTAQEVGSAGLQLIDIWRRRSESNRRTRLCRPLHDHSATPPGGTALRGYTLRYKPRGRALALPRNSGAGKESRTPDLNLGKVALYQLSYSRVAQPSIIAQARRLSNCAARAGLRQLRSRSSPPRSRYCAN
jgi:hypothetical protein